jgi:adenylate cyclase
MEIHRLLKRQLKKILGRDDLTPPSLDQWQQFLERVSHTYTEADQERYTLERSLSLSSEEMQELHKKVKKQNVILHHVLTRYLSEEIAQEILKNPDEKLKLGGETALVSVLFADIRGFTNFSKARDAKVVMRLLNKVFGRVVTAIYEHNGTFDKYMGDAVMAFFGAPISYDDDALRAVKTAVKMQEVLRTLQDEDEEVRGLGMGIGIFTGYAVVGNLGSERIMNYTVIGDTPNCAMKIQGNAKSGQVLIDAVTYEAVLDWVEAKPLEPIMLKGKKAPVTVYEVAGLQ